MAEGLYKKGTKFVTDRRKNEPPIKESRKEDRRMSVVTAPLPLSDDHPDELLNRPITPSLETEETDFEEIYEIERTIKLLKEGGFKTIALQFPDDLLHDAAKMSRRLQNGVDGAKTYILADTSYGSCCVDEIAAEHIHADVVVHYGRACLSPYLIAL